MSHNTNTQFSRQTKRAFTLIEILITLTIISLVSTALLVNFNSSDRIGRELEGSAREVASAFREAQNYALTGYQGVAGTDPCRFDVSWGGSTYGTVYRYKDALGACTRSAALRSYELRNGIVFSGAGSFYFTLPHADVSFGAESQPVGITKAGSGSTICVYRSGLINHFTGATCP